MFNRLLITSSIIVAMTSVGAIAADTVGKKPADGARPNLYKESQAKPNATPQSGAIKSNDTRTRQNLYKESQAKPNAAPAPGAVDPDSAMKRKKKPE